MNKNQRIEHIDKLRTNRYNQIMVKNLEKELNKCNSTNCKKCNSMIIYKDNLTKSDRCYCVRCFEKLETVLIDEDRKHKEEIERLTEIENTENASNMYLNNILDDKNKDIKSLQQTIFKLNEIVVQKDKVIDVMTDYIRNLQIMNNSNIMTAEEIKRDFEIEAKGISSMKITDKIIKLIKEKEKDINEALSQKNGYFKIGCNINYINLLERKHIKTDNLYIKLERQNLLEE